MEKMTKIKFIEDFQNTLNREVERVNKILYNALFYGWVEITEEQKRELIKHMNNGITALPKDKKQEYIKSKFKCVK